MLYSICCDVGSAGVRVAIIEYQLINNYYQLNSQPFVVKTRPLKIYNLKKDFYEQKTSEIWSAFCLAAQDCLEVLKKRLSLDDNQLLPLNSIGFTATCSLVIVETDDNSVDNDSKQCDVIMWMDHRAKEEAKLINLSGNSVLNQFGGICSPELSLAKLLWIHNNQPNRFNQAKAFMELPDWLTYRCSKSLNEPENFPRSLCSVVCKWGYDANKNEWPEDLFNNLGVNLETFKHKIGTNIIRPGLPIGYLSENAAKEMGITSLIDSIVISSSLIDAHAGAISMLIFSKSIFNDQKLQQPKIDPFENVLCMISGTSTCHMILNKKASSTRGVWGPYCDAILPGYFLREAGQSATGKLIEHIINSHQNQNETIINFKEIIQNLNQKLQEKHFYHETALIVSPTFHGNRSPIADSRLKGAIYGMTLDHHSLMDIYVATIEAIAYETKFIVEEIEKNSQPIEKILVSGGLTKNDLYLQIHADVLEKQLFIYDVGDADHMLTGAAIIANISFQAKNLNCKQKPESTELNLLTILNKIRASSTKTRIIYPRKEYLQYHQKKYKCFRALVDCCIQIENIYSSSNDNNDSS